MALPEDQLFIAADYIRKKTAINDAVDAELMRVAIYTAQDMYVQLSLGTDLYQSLKTKVAAGTLSGVYLTLMQTYVMPLTLWYTMVELYPNLWIKHDNGGLHHRISDDTQYIDSFAYDRLVANAREKAKFYATRMEEYLCANASSFAEYTSNTWPDISPKTTGYNSGATHFGHSSRRGSCPDNIYNPLR